MATDRVSLIHFDKLSMSPAAADRFQKALDALEALKLQDRYVYLIAPYLGDIADASDAEQLDTALGQCIRVAHHNGIQGGGGVRAVIRVDALQVSLHQRHGGGLP